MNAAAGIAWSSVRLFTARILADLCVDAFGWILLKSFEFNASPWRGQQFPALGYLRNEILRRIKGRMTLR